MHTQEHAVCKYLHLKGAWLYSPYDYESHQSKGIESSVA